MTPIVRIIAIAGRETQDIALRVHAQPQNGAVHIIEVTRHLVDLEDLAVGEPGGTKVLNILFTHLLEKEG